MYYFAYGSNMDKEDLDKWCMSKKLQPINFNRIIPVQLEGYKLVFNFYSKGRNGGVANIVKSSQGTVYGLLIDIEPDDLKKIRKKEGWPRTYSEIKIQVETFDGDIIKGVFTYKVMKDKTKKEHQPPTNYYLNLIINSARKYKFPNSYLEYLEGIETKKELERFF